MNHGTLSVAKKDEATGTKEWAIANVNCVKGCGNGCKYCYSKNMAQRFGRIGPAGWTDEQVNEAAVNRSYGKKNGTIMFPSAHDLTPKTLPACLVVLKKLLKAGNNVLVVSKPRLDCIRTVCEELRPWQSQVAFRFTITSDDDAILAYWEPNAPRFQERLASLKFAKGAGYRTSVSMEPILDAPNAVRLFRKLAPFVTDAIWIGKMNMPRQRVKVVTEEDERMLKAVEEGQEDSKFQALYEELKGEALVKWKNRGEREEWDPETPRPPSGPTKKVGTSGLELIDLRKADWSGCLNTPESYLSMVEQVFGKAPPNGFGAWISPAAFGKYVKSGKPGLWDVLWMMRASPSRRTVADGTVFEFMAGSRKARLKLSQNPWSCDVALVLPEEQAWK